MRRLVLVVLLAGLAVIGVVAARSPAARRAANRSLWQPVSPGVGLRTFRAPGSDVPITALRTDPARLRVVAGDLLDAAGWRRRTGAVAAVNGGFFDTDGRPLGLRTTGGRQLHPLLQRDWGVFLIGDGKARIVHTRDFHSGDGTITEAIQCGPRLVVDGRPVRLKPQSSRRTGIGIQPGGSVVLAVADEPLAFAEWAALWAARDGLDCVDALNLDGGGSSQLSVNAQRHAVEIKGSWPVPDAVVVR